MATEFQSHLSVRAFCSMAFLSSLIQFLSVFSSSVEMFGYYQAKDANTPRVQSSTSSVIRDMEADYLILCALAVIGLVSIQCLDAQAIPTTDEVQPQSQTGAVSGIQHIIWVWFENREATPNHGRDRALFYELCRGQRQPDEFLWGFASFPAKLPGRFLRLKSRRDGDGYCTFPASTDNLAKQLATAGKSWRVYAQNFPGSCFDGDSFTGGVDGPGLAGQYVRKHNPAIGFESVRLDAIQCAYIQPLANFDPTVNFAFVVPNMTNDMHDGTTAQGDAFLQAFVPLVTASPDWAHTLLIVTFDEGTTSMNGGGHIYTAAAAPWLAHANVATTYNHFSVLRTIEEVYGLPFLGSAATATTITELLPLNGNTDTFTDCQPLQRRPHQPRRLLRQLPLPLRPHQRPHPRQRLQLLQPIHPHLHRHQQIHQLRHRLPRPSTSRLGCEFRPVIVLVSVDSSSRERAPKHVLVRAIGPSLTQVGVPDALADPVLELHGPGGFATITDDNWRDDPVQEAAIHGQLASRRPTIWNQRSMRP